MFKVGDKVVCINDIDMFNNEIKLYNTYTIKHLTPHNIFVYFNEIDKSSLCNNFISLTEFRKQKIKKICSRK